MNLSIFGIYFDLSISNKYLNTFVKLAIFIGLGFVLYKQVFTNADVRQALQSLKGNLFQSRGLFGIVLILTVVNWAFETVKWRKLVNRLDQISFKEAFFGILLGISFSLFTPNRLGEYGGRVLVLKKNRIAAIVSTLIGSYSQIAVNMTLGGLACIIYLWKYLHVSLYLVFSVWVIYLILAVFLFISYFNLEVVSIVFRKYSIFKKISPYIDVVKKYTSEDLKFLLVISILRYATYCLQFLLLLKVFRAGVQFLDGLVLIPNVFFVQSVLPTMAIFDVSLRGQLALQFISEYAGGELIQIIAASLVLWFINLIIPSLIGGFIALFYKFDK